MKLKYFFASFLILTSTLTHACEEDLLKFPVECQFQDRFQIVKETFEKDFNVDVDDILDYRVPRFIDRKSWELAKKEERYNPANIYKPAPLTWELWSKAELYTRHNTDEKFSVLDLQNLHRQAMDVKIMTIWSVVLKGARPGKIRSKSTQLPPQFFYDCQKSKISQEKVNFYKNYDVLDSEGKSMLHVSFSECSEAPGFYSGEVKYLSSAKVPSELKSWLKSYNKPLLENVSPIEAAADLQRKFVSIHPFGDGNGRTSRFMQDLYLKRWKLPAPASSDLQNDLETPKEIYREQMKKAMETSMRVLEKCLAEYKASDISPTCKTEKDL